MSSLQRNSHSLSWRRPFSCPQRVGGICVFSHSAFTNWSSQNLAALVRELNFHGFDEGHSSNQDPLNKALTLSVPTDPGMEVGLAVVVRELSETGNAFKHGVKVGDEIYQVKLGPASFVQRSTDISILYWHNNVPFIERCP